MLTKLLQDETLAVESLVQANQRAVEENEREEEKRILSSNPEFIKRLHDQYVAFLIIHHLSKIEAGTAKCWQYLLL